MNGFHITSNCILLTHLADQCRSHILCCWLYSIDFLSTMAQIHSSSKASWPLGTRIGKGEKEPLRRLDLMSKGHVEKEESHSYGEFSAGNPLWFCVCCFNGWNHNLKASNLAWWTRLHWSSRNTSLPSLVSFNSSSWSWSATRKHSVRVNWIQLKGQGCGTRKAQLNCRQSSQQTTYFWSQGLIGSLWLD